MLRKILKFFLISAFLTFIVLCSYGCESDESPAIASIGIADSETILFQSDIAGNCEICSIRSDSTEYKNLSNNPYKDICSARSNDRTKIVFSTDRNDSILQSYTMNPDGSNPAKIPNLPNNAVTPSFSPDGTKIIFSSRRTGNAEIFLMNNDGSNPVNISNSPLSNEYRAVYSPDGTRIAFSSDRDKTPENYDIYIMNADGTDIRRLTESSFNNYVEYW